MLALSTWRAIAVVKQYAVLVSTPSADWRACLTGERASRLCWAVKRASRATSTTRERRTARSCSATDQAMESYMREKTELYEIN